MGIQTPPMNKPPPPQKKGRLMKRYSNSFRLRLYFPMNRSCDRNWSNPFEQIQKSRYTWYRGHSTRSFVLLLALLALNVWRKRFRSSSIPGYPYMRLLGGGGEAIKLWVPGNRSHGWLFTYILPSSHLLVVMAVMRTLTRFMTNRDAEILASVIGASGW